MSMVQDTTFGEFSVPGRGGLTGLYHAWMARRLRRARLMELRRTVETLREISPHLLTDIGLGCSDDVALQGRLDHIDVRL